MIKSKVNVDGVAPPSWGPINQSVGTVLFLWFFFSFFFSAFIRVINSLVFNRLLDNLNKFCLLYFQVHAHKWCNVLCGKTDRKA